ncbi:MULTISPECIES: hypothetical protein [unclassified Nocardiopsis]|uniref:hypothetical protein n=1 Tax=unclassified Nocardiopsis TaxID=2649073 RepID=UPI001357A6ED|nr:MULTISPECIES: hypothetical protein [unclassified Nocardiopsis]
MAGTWYEIYMPAGSRAVPWSKVVVTVVVILLVMYAMVIGYEAPAAVALASAAGYAAVSVARRLFR